MRLEKSETAALRGQLKLDLDDTRLQISTQAVTQTFLNQIEASFQGGTKGLDPKDSKLCKWEPWKPMSQYTMFSAAIERLSTRKERRFVT